MDNAKRIFSFGGLNAAGRSGFFLFATAEVAGEGAA
jgi:hypothetical protein